MAEFNRELDYPAAHSTYTACLPSMNHVRCEFFGEAFGQFELGDLSKVAFVDLVGQLSPLPKTVGDPRSFFAR
jgi:hypothetical protein